MSRRRIRIGGGGVLALALMVAGWVTEAKGRRPASPPLRASQPVAAPVSAAAGTLEERLSRLVPATLQQPERLGLVIGEADTARVLFRQFPEESLVPASIMKLLTAATALYYLGEDYQFETNLWARGPVRAGVLEGDLVLGGTGDPGLGGRLDDSPDRLAVVRGWVEALKNHGIREVAGNLLLDDTAFPGPAYPECWPAKERHLGYAPETSALAYNENSLDIVVTAGKDGGGPAFRLSPATEFVTVQNRAVTQGKKNELAIYRTEQPNAWLLKGKCGKATADLALTAPVEESGLYLGSLLYEEMARRGVGLRGKIRRATSPVPGAGMTLLAQTRHPVIQFLPVMLKDSVNFYAEQILLGTALRARGSGDRVLAVAAVKAALEGWRIDTARLVIKDGSGLSHDNRVTAQAIFSLLARVRTFPWYLKLQDALAVGGVDGTLVKRMKSPSLQGKVWAKTGHILGVNTIAGYLKAKHRTYAFALLFNQLSSGPKKSALTSKAVGELQDKLLEAVAAWDEERGG